MAEAERKIGVMKPIAVWSVAVGDLVGSRLVVARQGFGFFSQMISPHKMCDICFLKPPPCHCYRPWFMVLIFVGVQRHRLHFVADLDSLLFVALTPLTFATLPFCCIS